ncbi:hypothetical protein JOD29_002407 [Lysinibacillus composti]|uniref:PD-(D/E)XK endonuclease-like domain-containing protein n=1 Tax=Lysinibacillus composti TaxID=720633 RepID=A0A3N9UCQ5_9BACI|nr:hypothetical protein [Lysinibacillus composti]MBM7609141.1 hypothetical protein [Lysinibacillus composti]RQW74199.1 hypothetical protein EBB45_12635 [Lysinibacillus composti]
MAIRVLTYSTVEQLYEENSAFLQWNDSLHITSTVSLRKGIFENLAEENDWLTRPVLTFGQILNKIGNKDWYWYSSKTQLKQFSIISQKLRELAEENGIQDEKTFNAMSKNKQVLLRTIRMFTEAKETSDSVRRKLSNKVSVEEELALIIWKALERDGTFAAYRQWLAEFTDVQSTDAKFTSMVGDILLDVYNNENELERQMANLKPLTRYYDEKDLEILIHRATKSLLSSKKIVLHGFYFITPIQKQIIKALDAAGYEIVQLINYQENYPNVFEAVEDFLEIEKYPFEPVSKTPAFINKIAQKFLQVCEGDFSLDITNMPDKYFEFNHMYQFKEFIENDMQIDKEINDFLISPRAREIRRQVEDINSMPPLTLKDYPIGRFLIDLHSLNITTFDEEKKQFNDREELSIDILVRIFASGYIKVSGTSTHLLVKDLKKLEERLNNKTTFEEWIVEIETIIDDKNRIEAALTPDDITLTADNEIYVYKNRLLSYFDVPEENLKLILEALEEARNLYNIIFTDKTIEVKMYVERLLEHLEGKIVPNIEREEEIAVAEQLLEKLNDMRSSDFEHFDRQDLIQGLRFFLSEELENTDNSLFGESLIDSKIVSLQDGDFLPFAENQSVHLAFLDNKALPLSQKLVTWPFNDDSMEVLYKDSLLELVQKRKKNDAAITKYLLYLIMVNAANLKFSTVANVGVERELKRSFYLDLLKIETASSDVKENGLSTNMQQINYISKTISFKKRKQSALLLETKTICNKRMILSYLLQQSPSFESEFHHRFLFEKFIAQLKFFSRHYSIDLSKNEIREVVSDWFPQWDETKRSILATNGEKWDYYMKSEEIDDVFFADNLKSIALFGQLDRDATKFANSGSHCKYCPFQNRCRESEYIKDE